MKKIYAVVLGFVLLIIVILAGWIFSLEQPKRAAYLGDAVSQHDLALNYLDERDYPNAFKWGEKAAIKGNADAQMMLCAFYYEGQGVEQDYSKAFEWCEKSANQGNSNAQSTLGSMYYNGNGVEKDYAEAFDLFKTGAYRGDNNSQLKLCAMYAEGQGVRQDYSRAFEWCEKSANQGNIHASFNMALMYLRGEGVEQDIDLATELFGKACDNRIQNGCDEYKRLNALKAQSVLHPIPNKPSQYEEVFDIPAEEEFDEAELRAMQRQEEEEAEFRANLAEIEAAQAELRDIQKQAELLY